MDYELARFNMVEQQIRPWLVLDQALTEFARVEPDTARVVELRLFAGLQIDELARLRDVHERTVRREWKLTRVWLYRRLTA